MSHPYRLRPRRPSQRRRPRSIISEGLLIAGATAVIYLLTFAFEYGYCGYFGVPGFLIEPSPGTILFTALFVTLIGVGLIEASYLPRLLLAAIPWPGLRTRFVFIAFMWGAPVLIGAPIGWLQILSLSTWTLLILNDYIYALIFRPGSFAERVSQGESDSKTSMSPWDGPMKVFGRTVVGLVTIVYLAVLAAWLAGATYAHLQEGFIVLKSAPDVAVIKRYGDRFVAIRYAGTPAQATGEFRVIDQEKDMEFINLDKLSIRSVRKRTESKANK